MTEAGVFRAAFDMIFDPVVGIVGAFGEVPAEAGAPRFCHYRARLCDTARLGGAPTERVVESAAVEREAAAVAALERGLARYAAALYHRDGLPVAAADDAAFPCLPPESFALFSERQYAEPGFPYVPFAGDTPVKWTSVVDLASGETAYAPAALVWFPFSFVRAAGDMPIAGNDPGGFACAGSVAAAALAGLYDVVARDAALLFWQAMTQPRRLALDTLPKGHRGLVSRFVASGAAVTILDATTDNRIPSFVAVAASEKGDHPAHVLAAAAHLDPGAAVEAVLLDLAATWAFAARIGRSRPAPCETNGWEDVLTAADHVAFAADHANRGHFAARLSSEEVVHLADFDETATGSVDGDLEAAIARIMATGHRVCAANLTSEDIAGVGLHVCRTLVPGYLPLFAGHRQRALGGARLYEVPRKLGHRGVARGSGGNPAPHPFR